MYQNSTFHGCRIRSSTGASPICPSGGYPYPPAPPVIVISPWGGLLQGPGYPPHGVLPHGYLHLSTAQPVNILQVTAHSSTSGPNSSCFTSPTFSNVTDAMSPFSIDDVLLARISSISAWLKSLDDHEEQGKDNIGFTQFAHIFEQEGFLHLFQLSGEFMSWNDLQGMLNVPYGITLHIMLYTKQDL
ncbi:hypothetical protein J3R82DRAFT_5506 [Butyriboletus roseoflavus]|nr:hypothetical protein J3R82DRAFT_5506 [Butyriboletus roseoflavus]